MGRKVLSFAVCLALALSLCLVAFSQEATKKEDPWKSVKGNKYKKIHKEGYCNCIFSTKALALGKEETYNVKDKFVKPEPVYARCYFPGPVGEVKPEDYWNEIWIDGELKLRTFYEEPPGADWSTTQIWITEDTYTKVMEELEPGEHEIIIWVTKNEYKGEKAVAGEEADGKIVGKMKEIWVPKGLSIGKFIYIVPK
ncbi:MAG: hypothetical protein COS84_00890 [Armatimonadetes bacterium CG07_land_8_20_14_0_80_40_9]|nr:MAG: hypothetical protein COS84_00890 [Armatimonadetes bacterium CG07_land_8_20_14_0_80_40_9]